MLGHGMQKARKNGITPFPPHCQKFHPVVEILIDMFRQATVITKSFVYCIHHRHSPTYHAYMRYPPTTKGGLVYFHRHKDMSSNLSSRIHKLNLSSDVESDDYSESARSYELGKASDFACARPRPDFSAFLCLWRKITIGWEMRPARLIV